MAYPSVSFTAFDIYRSDSFILEGKIKDATTKTGIGNVHVFTVAGEEEAFSGRKGTFKLKTWKTFPVTLFIDHPDYAVTKVIIQDTINNQEILLQHK